jgi:riboflavin kinase/FMN adenylyltransferase
MKVLRDPLGSEDPPRGGILSIGVFDGVHLGHQKVLTYVSERAKSLGAPALAMTFDPHPVKLLRPADAPRLVTTLEQRLALIARSGIETCLLVPFTHRVSRMTAEDFVADVLVDRLAVREVYIGKNFRFGADRGGDVELLTRMGEKLGFTAASWPIVEHGGAVVSSTRVRRVVSEGRVAEAAELLDRAVFIDGQVLEGKRLGRTLGFPTLNIEVENELTPDHGVYVTAVHIPSFHRTFTAVTNVGVRPTIYENSLTTVESHLLDFTADVYQEKVRLFFFDRLRDERSFDSTTELMTQIRRDVEAARDYFEARPLEDLPLVLP